MNTFRVTIEALCVLLGRVGNLEAGKRVNERARLPVVPSAPCFFFFPVPLPHPLGASAEERAVEVLVGCGQSSGAKSHSKPSL